MPAGPTGGASGMTKRRRRRDKMRGNLNARLAATALLGVASAAGLGIGPGGSEAQAGGDGYRGYHPAPFYSAPPVYSYVPGHGSGRYPAGYAVSFYSTRVDIFK